MIAIAQGSCNAEIAASLHVSTATAKTHVSRILTKFDARDRTHRLAASRYGVTSESAASVPRAVGEVDVAAGTRTTSTLTRKAPAARSAPARNAS